MHNSDYPSDESLDAAATEVEMTPITIVQDAPLPPCHVMLDLETWGTGNDAVVVSIGACKFDKNDILDAFHVGVDPKSCMELGLKVDAGTILWWMDPSSARSAGHYGCSSSGSTSPQRSSASTCGASTSRAS
jgi:hypothetical protein